MKVSLESEVGFKLLIKLEYVQKCIDNIADLPMEGWKKKHTLWLIGGMH